MPKRIPRKVIRGIIYKQCSKCRKYKPTSEFHPHRHCQSDELQYYCKQCKHDYMMEYRKEHKDIAKADG